MSKAVSSIKLDASDMANKYVKAQLINDDEQNEAQTLHKDGSSNVLDGVKLLTMNDLLEIFPFGKTKLFKLLQAKVLPVVKIGNDYITTSAVIERWVEDNVGRELHY